MLEGGEGIKTKSVNEYYRVRNGDNLGRIASKNGVSVAQLKSWNGLKNDNISVGKNIIVKKNVEVIEPDPTEQYLASIDAPDDITTQPKEDLMLNVTEIIEINTSPIILE